MNRGKYQGEAYIYGYDEVIFLIRDMAEGRRYYDGNLFIPDDLETVWI